MVQAANGGALSLGAGNWENTGQIQVGDASTLNLGGTFTNSGIGTISRTGTNTVNLTGTVTGGLTLDDTLGSWNFKGGTIENGPFAIASGSTAKLLATTTAGFLDNVTLNSPVDLSMNNAAVVALNGLTINTSQPIGPSTLIGGAAFRFQGDQTVRTDGGGEFVFSIGVGNYVGPGTSGGDGNYTLTIAPGVTIRGAFGRVSNTGGALINQGVIRAEGDTTEPLDVDFGNGSRNEGTITSVGAWLRVLGNVTTAWSNLGEMSVTGAGKMQIGLQTTETWNNLGTIEVRDTSTLTLAGGGAAAGKPMTQANLGNIVRDPTATIKLTGITLTGDLNLDDNTGSWILAGGTLQNGAINTSGAAKLIGVAVAGGESYLTNEIINGNFDLTTSNNNLYVAGGLTINGTLNVGDAAGTYYTQFNIRDDQTWDGIGSLVFGGSSNSITSGVTKTLTIGTGLTLRGKKVTISSLPTFTNRGTIETDVAGGVFDINPSTFSNLGTVGASNGATVQMDTTSTSALANLTNQTLSGSIYSATLTGGSWYVGPSSTLRFYYNTTTGVRITNIDADVTLDGGGSNIYGGPSSSATYMTYDALNALSAIGADGGLTLTNGRNLSPPGNFSNAGSLVIGLGSSFTPTGATYAQTGGSTWVQSGGTLLAPGKTIQLEGGALKGTGTINADVTNSSGTVAPGNSPGFLDVTGDYVQGPGGTLNLEIAGRDPNVPEFDRLRVTGTATIDGTIHVDLLDGFQPAPGDEFQVVSSAGLTLQSALAYQLPAPGGPLRELAPISDALNLTLRAQQIPPINFDSATTAGGAAPSAMIPRHVAVDAAGNSYFTGEFTGTVDFDKEHSGGDLTSTSTTGAAFIAKYAPDGSLVWVYKLDTTGNSANDAAGFGLAIDSNGNNNAADDSIWITGSFRNDITYSGPSGSAISGDAGSSDAFVLKVDASGTEQVFEGFGSTGQDIGAAVAVGPSGNAYVGGGFNGTVDFNPAPGRST